MYIQHYYGPFYANQAIDISLETVYKILQVGVETLHSTPMSFYTTTDTYQGSAVPARIKIDDMTYAIMDNDILEFDNLNQSKMRIEFLKDFNPYTVINLVYKDVDE